MQETVCPRDGERDREWDSEWDSEPDGGHDSEQGPHDQPEQQAIDGSPARGLHTVPSHLVVRES